jgi:hypothetical protein
MAVFRTEVTSHVNKDGGGVNDPKVWPNKYANYLIIIQIICKSLLHMQIMLIDLIIIQII